jgi:hypothetical protein
VQEHNVAMFFAELRQSTIQRLYALESLLIKGRIVRSGQAGDAVPAQLTFRDYPHTLARVAASLIDKEVVHNARQPRTGIVNAHEIVHFDKCLDKQLLKQVLCFGLLSGETPRKTI